MELRPDAKAASWSGRLLSLTDQQFRLLHLLAEQAPGPISREDMWEQVWPDYQGIEPQRLTIEQAIRRLRRELKRAAGINPIRAVRALGYRLEI